MFKNISAAALMGSFLATTAWAGIAKEVTESGGLRLTGGIGQVESYGLSRVLMETNNILFGSGPVTEATGLVDGFAGLSLAKQGLAIGYLSPGSQGTVYTYDVLVSVPVLQLLGYDQTGQVLNNPEYLTMTGGAEPLLDGNFWSGFGGASGGARRSGGSGGEVPPDDGFNGSVIPEPASGVGLMIGAGWWMLSRRRQRSG